MLDRKKDMSAGAQTFDFMVGGLASRQRSGPTAAPAADAQSDPGPKWAAQTGWTCKFEDGLASDSV